MHLEPELRVGKDCWGTEAVDYLRSDVDKDLRCGQRVQREPKELQGPEERRGQHGLGLQGPEELQGQGSFNYEELKRYKSGVGQKNYKNNTTVQECKDACLGGTGRPRGLHGAACVTHDAPRIMQHACADHMESTRAAVGGEEGRHLERGVMSKVSLAQDLAKGK